MRYARLMSALATSTIVTGTAAAQQGREPFDPVQIEFKAQSAAGRALLEAAERYFNESIFGPESKTCDFITDAIEHFTKAAVAVGALGPGVNPTMLTNEQHQVLNQKTGAQFERNEAIRKKACAVT